jgi:hypothetical protein
MKHAGDTKKGPATAQPNPVSKRVASAAVYQKCAKIQPLLDFRVGRPSAGGEISAPRQAMRPLKLLSISTGFQASQ